MKFFQHKGHKARHDARDAHTGEPEPASPRADRRGVVVGAGVAGAAALATAALHGRIAAPAAGEKIANTPPEQGYRETEHVLRYYQTTRA